MTSVLDYKSLSDYWGTYPYPAEMFVSILHSFAAGIIANAIFSFSYIYNKQ